MKPKESDSDAQPRPGFFARLRQRFERGSASGLRVLGWLTGRRLDDEVLEEIEERLLLADAGIDATRRIVSGLQRRPASETSQHLEQALADELTGVLAPRAVPLEIDPGQRPFVILMVGVNGSGKTTTIGKLAHWLQSRGLSVLLAAGDTYRAAATEQLQAWGARNGVPVIAQSHGADPAAVIFDAIAAAQARKTDVVLADTAGRLQNQAGLMRELQKIVRIAGRSLEGAPHEIMLVLDASLGQNALVQARQFQAAAGVTGITLTKLDGGAKGGILLAIANELEIPIRFIGIGEQQDDLAVFDAPQFVKALLGTGEPADKAGA